jgi:hypothetical protein
MKRDLKSQEPEASNADIILLPQLLALARFLSCGVICRGYTIAESDLRMDTDEFRTKVRSISQAFAMSAASLPDRPVGAR